MVFPETLTLAMLVAPEKSEAREVLKVLISLIAVVVGIYFVRKADISKLI